VNYDIMAYRYLLMKVNISAGQSVVIQTVMMGKDRLFCVIHISLNYYNQLIKAALHSQLFKCTEASLQQ